MSRRSKGYNGKPDTWQNRVLRGLERNQRRREEKRQEREKRREQTLTEMTEERR
jgi:hypothetical protein